jgi:bacterioferritin-associated ferredoxin
MIVCLCRRVTDRAIRDLVADGAASVDEVAARCGAGTGCGGCRQSVAHMVAERLCAPDAAPVALDARAA